jgi:hypothetical protein
MPYLLYVGLPIILLFLLNMILASSTVKFIMDAKRNMNAMSDAKSTSKDRNR